jgi:hypothetical protein
VREVNEQFRRAFFLLQTNGGALPCQAAVPELLRRVETVRTRNQNTESIGSQGTAALTALDAGDILKHSGKGFFP